MSNRQRHIELDLLRSLAFVLMVIYHTGYDLSHFYSWDIDVFHGGWKALQLVIASLFLFLVGVSAYVSGNRHIWKRLVRIGGAALLVSIGTYVIDPETYVRFGILHLIAVSALLIPLMTRFRRPGGASLLLLGTFIIGIGSFINQWHTGGVAQFIGIPLGIPPLGFTTVDYYPLVPWFGVVLIGYGVGCLIYAKKLRASSYELRETPSKTRSSQLLVLAASPGRHSLLLYLIHQPIIIGVLWILLGPPKF